MSGPRKAFNDLREFVKANLKECCEELVEWSNSAVLRDGRVREATKIIEQFASF